MSRTAEWEIDVVSRRIGMYARGDTGISSNSKKSSQNTLDSSRFLSKSLVCCTPYDHKLLKVKTIKLSIDTVSPKQWRS